MDLNSKHLSNLRESSLTDETIQRYGIVSLTETQVRHRLSRKDIDGGGWLIKYPHGSEFFKIRLDNPVGEAKYLSPAGMSPDLFITFKTQEHHYDIASPYFFVEGEKKALALEQLGYSAISVPGVWGWKSKGHVNEALTKLLLKGRDCYIVFDIDKYDNPHVQKAEYAFALALKKIGANVGIINLPTSFGKGIDDIIKRFTDDGKLDDLKKQLANYVSYEDYIKSHPVKDKKQRKNKDGGSSPAELAAELCQQEKLIFAAETFFRYRDGVYRLCHEEIVRKSILKRTGLSVSFSKVNEILNFAKTCVFYNPESLNNTPLLNLRNGLFDTDNYKLNQHSSQILSTIQLPIDYDPNAKCDKFLKTLDEIFDGDEGKIGIYQEFCGLCLTRETKYEKSLICVGEGANGKGLLLKLHEELLGRENCTAIPLEKFNDPHYVANLFGKLANISLETSAKSEVYDSHFKAITSGDSIQADQKFKHPFKFRPFAKLIFAMNNLPRVDDKTNAFFRRLIILRFLREFSESEQNKNLINELLLELNGIFLWYLEGLKRLRNRGYFDIPDQVQAEINEYRKDNNNIIIFVEDKCRLDAGESIDKGALYEIYSSYCKGNNYRPLSKKKFGMELKKQFKTVHDGRSGSDRYWEGINTDITK